jgi:hypothetical protein
MDAAAHPDEPGEAWSFSSLLPVEGDTPGSSPPHVSLFSPDVPPILPAVLPDAAPAGSSSSSSSSAHVSAFTPASASRTLPPLPSLAPLAPLAPLEPLANMPKRSARLRLSDTHRAPIVQLHTRIPEAQKSGDDPSTPLENTSRKRTTMDLTQSEHTTMTSLSNLFSGTAITSHSRAPSYNNATGPLYLRSMPLRDPLETDD